MSKLKCRRCRKIHARSDLVRKPMKNNSGWTKNVCPNCGGGVFDCVDETVLATENLTKNKGGEV